MFPIHLAHLCLSHRPFKGLSCLPGRGLGKSIENKPIKRVGWKGPWPWLTESVPKILWYLKCWADAAVSHWQWSVESHFLGFLSSCVKWGDRLRRHRCLYPVSWLIGLWLSLWDGSFLKTPDGSAGVENCRAKLMSESSSSSGTLWPLFSPLV